LEPEPLTALNFTFVLNAVTLVVKSATATAALRRPTVLLAKEGSHGGGVEHSGLQKLGLGAEPRAGLGERVTTGREAETEYNAYGYV
jgi:hypothetical protein